MCYQVIYVTKSGEVVGRSNKFTVTVTDHIKNSVYDYQTPYSCSRSPDGMNTFNDCLCGCSYPDLMSSSPSQDYRAGCSGCPHQNCSMGYCCPYQEHQMGYSCPSQDCFCQCHDCFCPYQDYATSYSLPFQDSHVSYFCQTQDISADSYCSSRPAGCSCQAQDDPGGKSSKPADYHSQSNACISGNSCSSQDFPDNNHCPSKPAAHSCRASSTKNSSVCNSSPSNDCTSNCSSTSKGYPKDKSCPSKGCRTSNCCPSKNYNSSCPDVTPTRSKYAASCSCSNGNHMCIKF